MKSKGKKIIICYPTVVLHLALLLAKIGKGRSFIAAVSSDLGRGIGAK
jgi:hypothetical protein